MCVQESYFLGSYSFSKTWEEASHFPLIIVGISYTKYTNELVWESSEGGNYECDTKFLYTLN